MRLAAALRDISTERAGGAARLAAVVDELRTAGTASTAAKETAAASAAEATAVRRALEDEAKEQRVVVDSALRQTEVAEERAQGLERKADELAATASSMRHDLEVRESTVKEMKAAVESARRGEILAEGRAQEVERRGEESAEAAATEMTVLRGALDNKEGEAEELRVGAEAAQLRTELAEKCTRGLERQAKEWTTTAVALRHELETLQSEMAKNRARELERGVEESRWVAAAKGEGREEGRREAEERWACHMKLLHNPVLRICVNTSRLWPSRKPPGSD